MRQQFWARGAVYGILVTQGVLTALTSLPMATQAHVAYVLIVFLGWDIVMVATYWLLAKIDDEAPLVRVLESAWFHVPASFLVWVASTILMPDFL